MPDTNKDSIFAWQILPVSAFINQSRTTADYTSASFIISWLSGIAYVVAEHLGGHLSPAQQKSSMYLAIKSASANSDVYNDIPNKGKVKVSHDFQAKQVQEAVLSCWQALAEQIWQSDFSPWLGSKGENKDELYAQFMAQINHFFQFQWLITESTDYTGLELAGRKRRVNTLTLQQSGLTCQLIKPYACLSMAKSNSAAASFWQKLKTHKPELSYAVKEGERLSAIAYVRRRFKQFFADFKHELVIDPSNKSNKLKLSGLAINNKVPSTEEMAGFLNPVNKNHACKRQESQSYIEDESLPYYALLELDGDKVGPLEAKARAKGKEDVFSNALIDFYTEAKAIVQECQGHLFYLGGDELRVMLPRQTSLNAAKKLSLSYHKQLNKLDFISNASCSLALIFCHSKVPLGANLSHLAAGLRQAKEVSQDCLYLSAFNRKRIDFESLIQIKPSELDGEVRSRIDAILQSLYTFKQLASWSNQFIMRAKLICQQSEVEDRQQRRLGLAGELYNCRETVEYSECLSQAEQLINLGLMLECHESSQLTSALLLCKKLNSLNLILDNETTDDN